MTASTTTLTQKILSIISPILKEANIDSYSIFLFGSYAKGTQKDGSDIDLAIKADRPLDFATWGKIEGALDDSALFQPFDVLDYLSVSPEFQSVIDRDGIRIASFSKSER